MLGKFGVFSGLFCHRCLYLSLCILASGMSWPFIVRLVLLLRVVFHLSSTCSLDILHVNYLSYFG